MIKGEARDLERAGPGRGERRLAPISAAGARKLLRVSSLVAGVIGATAAACAPFPGPGTGASFLVYTVGLVLAAGLLLEVLTRSGRRREADLRLRLREATMELEQANARLEEMATRDELTGIRNRRFFLEQLELEWQRGGQTREPVSLVLADIDAFKALNDTYGHPEGDSSLARVAACMRAAARRPSDCVARIGGEEFAILLPGTKADGAVAFAERVRRDVEALRIPNVDSAVCPSVTISLGVSTTRPRPTEGTPTLMAAADRALAKSKTGGRNRVCFEEWAPAAASASARG
jgi:diguanylate cyclase (GGDEF)-like protein